MAFHPHWPKWMQFCGLVHDGVSFSRARFATKADRGLGQEAYQPVASRAKVAKYDERGGRDGSSSSSISGERKSKRSNKERTSKGNKAKRDQKISNATDGASEVVQPIKEAATKQEDEETERLLQEERSAGVHSSQQAIKVVGLNG